MTLTQRKQISEEEIARVIDPSAYAAHDASIRNAAFWEARGDPGGRAPRDRQNAADHIKGSLTKARAILALIGEGGAVREDTYDSAELDAHIGGLSAELMRLRALLGEAVAVLEPFALADNLDSKIVGVERVRLLRGCVSNEDFRAASSLVARLREEANRGG